MISSFARISASKTWCFCSSFILSCRLLGSCMEGSSSFCMRSLIQSSACSSERFQLVWYAILGPPPKACHCAVQPPLPRLGRLKWHPAAEVGLQFLNYPTVPGQAHLGLESGLETWPQVGRETWPFLGGGPPRSNFIPLPLPAHNPN